MLRSPLLPIFLTVFVDVLGLTLILPLLPFYAERFGATPVVVGALAASFALCQLISGPILGRISDRVGRKPTLLASQAGTFVGFVVLASAQTLPMLFLGRMIDGITAGNLSIAQAYISDVTKPENRTKAFALIGIAFGMGFLIGPAIAGLLANRLSPAAPIWMAAALSATSIIFTSLLLPQVTPTPAPSAQPGRWLAMGHFLRHAVTRKHLFEFFAFVLSFSTLIGGLALYLQSPAGYGFDVEKTGLIYAFSGLVGALIQGGAIGRLVKALGEARLARWGFVTMAIGYCFLGWVPKAGPGLRVPLLLAVVAFSSFGVAVTRPCITTLITRSVGRHEQGAALGVSQSLNSVAQIIGPLVAGFLIEHGRVGLWGLTASLFALGGVGLTLGALGREAATVGVDGDR